MREVVGDIGGIILLDACLLTNLLATLTVGRY